MDQHRQCTMCGWERSTYLLNEAGYCWTPARSPKFAVNICNDLAVRALPTCKDDAIVFALMTVVI